MESNLKVGFLGAGKMASALASGFVRAGITKKQNVIASDVSASARTSFSEAVGGTSVGFNPDVVKFASVVIVAVKPDQVADVLREVAPDINEQHLIVSIAAGVTLANMESTLPAGTRVVRVMPNTPALVGASASGFALGRSATAEDAQLVGQLFSAVGIALQVKES